MANKSEKKRNPSWFNKGCTPGPGRPHLAEDVKAFRNTFKSHLEGELLRMLNLNQGEIHKIHCSPDAPMYQLAIARFLQNIVSYGDVNRFNLLLDRVLGSVKQSPQIQIDIGQAQNTKVREITEQDRNRLLDVVLKLKSNPEDPQCKSILNSLQQSPQLEAQSSPARLVTACSDKKSQG